MINYIKTAFSAVWSNKVRSFLTVLGVVIGVFSVCILISISQGLKNDVSGLIQGLGSNIITVVSGKIDIGNSSSSQQNPAAFTASDILTIDDLNKIQTIKGISQVAPMSMVFGSVKYDDKTAAPTVIGTYPSAIKVINLAKIDKGKMFNKDDRDVIVLNPQSVKTLFPKTNPLGKIVKIGDKELTVIGTFKKIESSTSVTNEFNGISFIPFDTAAEINKNTVKIQRILVKADDNFDVKTVKSDIQKSILKLHKGEEDFSVMTQDDILNLFNQFLSLATLMVSAIAAISLVVGGIGIMNIMLVTVTERTKEIGLRKAVGATKGAILFQFLIEAIVITLLGGSIGLGLTYLTSYIIEVKTDLSPDISPQIIALALGISIIIGIIFGLWPAYRAAQKDPIEALRYE